MIHAVNQRTRDVTLCKRGICSSVCRLSDWHIRAALSKSWSIKLLSYSRSPSFTHWKHSAFFGVKRVCWRLMCEGVWRQLRNDMGTMQHQDPLIQCMLLSCTCIGVITLKSSQADIVLWIVDEGSRRLRRGWRWRRRWWSNVTQLALRYERNYRDSARPRVRPGPG